MTYLPNQSYILFILASMLVILTLGLPFDSTTPIPTTQSPVLYHNASHYCSQFDQCESCLKDHSKITNATKCSYKICVQPANDKLKSFPVCFPTDEDVPCPGNMQYMKKFDGLEGCSTIQQTGKAEGAPTPAPTPVTPSNNTTVPANTTTTTTPSVPTNVTTPIVPVNPNSTTTSPPTNATTIPSPTTTNTTTSVKPTTPPITTAGPTNKTTTSGSPITLSTTTIRPVPPATSTSRFSPSSFVGGMCLMAGLATLFYFGIKYYRSNVSRYRQF